MLKPGWLPQKQLIMIEKSWIRRSECNSSPHGGRVIALPCSKKELNFRAGNRQGRTAKLFSAKTSFKKKGRVLVGIAQKEKEIAYVASKKLYRDIPDSRIGLAGKRKGVGRAASFEK